MKPADSFALGARAALAVAIYAGFVVASSGSVSAPGIAALLDGSALTGIVAVGVGLTMIAGELDLSVGSMAALAGVLVIKAVALGPLAALILVVAAAALFGALQGFAISLLNINSLIFTVGTLIGVRGLALIAANETTPTLPIDMLSITDAVSARFWIVSPLSLTMIAAFLLAGYFAARTIWGREIFAIGGARAESKAAGVPQRRPIVIAFSVSAACAALAGGLLSLRSGSASPLGFDAVLLEAVAACLIGGVALDGGKGSFAGIFLGLMMLRVVVSGIASLGAPFWAQNLATGTLLIVVILGETIAGAAVRRRAVAANDFAEP